MSGVIDPTAKGHTWLCSWCGHKARTVEQASDHTREMGGEPPLPGHFMFEMPDGTRSHPRRAVYRDGGRVLIRQCRSRPHFAGRAA